MSVLKSFINELIYGLSDTAKAFLLYCLQIFLLDFHSTHGWEVVLENGLRHLDYLRIEILIFLFIATFPVSIRYSV